MPHIHTEPGQHDYTITGFIVRDDMDEPRLLLHMHRKLNKLLPPGGHIELNETPWAALSHEVREESGYTLDELELFQPKLRLSRVDGIIVHPQPILSNTHDFSNTHFHTDLDYLLIAHGASAGHPEEGESTDLRWLTIDEIRALSPEETFNNIREISEYIFTKLLSSTEYETVPANQFTTNDPEGRDL